MVPAMNIYNAWFDLKPGISDVAFHDRLAEYLGSLQSDGLMRGWRLMRRKLGLSAAPVGEFHLMMEFETWTSSTGRFNAWDRAGSRSKACISGLTRWFRTLILRCIAIFQIPNGTGAMKNSKHNQIDRSF
jgi:hypothetical protein